MKRRAALLTIRPFFADKSTYLQPNSLQQQARRRSYSIPPSQHKFSHIVIFPRNLFLSSTKARTHVPITPFPIPEITPPDTRTYFIFPTDCLTTLDNVVVPFWRFCQREGRNLNFLRTESLCARGPLLADLIKLNLFWTTRISSRVVRVAGSNLE